MRSSIIALILVAEPLWAEPPPAAAPAAPALQQADMQLVLRALQSRYADPGAVNYEALNRAAIAGLLKDNGSTIQILTVPAQPAAPPPLKSEAITPHITCIRPGTVNAAEATAARAILAKIPAGASSGVILDLRTAAVDTDPALAAEWAALFLPKGSAVTRTMKSAADPAWNGDLMVLVDEGTSNASEVLAAVLQHQQRAVLIGSRTRGRTATVIDLPLRKVDAGTLTLRYTAERVSFAEQVPDPFGKGLTPDIPAAMESAVRAAVFAAQEKEGMSRGVFQKAPPRANEAALVAKTNPEIPARIARTVGTAGPAELIDRPLQLAVDTLTARSLLKP